MTKSPTLWCALVFALGAMACTPETGRGPQPSHPTQGVEGEIGEASPTGVQPPPCPGDTAADIYIFHRTPLPRCVDVFSD